MYNQPYGQQKGSGSAGSAPLPVSGAPGNAFAANKLHPAASLGRLGAQSRLQPGGRK